MQIHSNSQYEILPSGFKPRRFYKRRVISSEVLGMKQRGMASKVIAEHYGCSITHINLMLRTKYGIKRWKKWDLLRERVKKPGKIQEIAKELGCGMSTVKKARREHKKRA